MSSAYDTLILATPNILAFWPGNGGTSSQTDATGNGHTLTLPTGVTTGAASLLLLDSEAALTWTNTVAAEGSIATPATLGSSTTPAVEYWIRYSHLSVGNQHDVRASGTGTGWGAGMKNGAGFLFTTFGHADTSFVAAPVVGTVYHVGMQLDAGGHASLIINGVIVQTIASVAITAGATAAGVGGMSSDSDFMQATIQKIAVYSAPLSAAQWAAHFAAGAGGQAPNLNFGRRPSLIAGSVGSANRSGLSPVLV